MRKGPAVVILVEALADRLDFAIGPPEMVAVAPVRFTAVYVRNGSSQRKGGVLFFSCSGFAPFYVQNSFFWLGEKPTAAYFITS